MFEIIQGTVENCRQVLLYSFTIINCVVLVYLFDNMSEINNHEGGTRSALHTNAGTKTNWSRKLLTAKRLIIYTMM